MLVTSALPYIHGVPHLGNLAGSILPADIYHRFLDIAGVDNLYICGSDEHGTPLALAAKKEGIPVAEYTDQQHEKVKNVLEQFNIDFSLYGRTHTPYNRKQTNRMFKQLYENGYITEKEQTLPHCETCDQFLSDRYIEGECPHCGGLARGDQCDAQDCGKLLDPKDVVNPYCTVCEEEDIIFKETKNLFIQLPKFEDELRAWLEENSPVPENVTEEVLNLLDDGLEDRCITRDLDWGFPVPTEDIPELDDDIYGDKVLYVWFDAPIGYIGITRQHCDEVRGNEDEWTQWWLNGEAETVYSMGKDNTIFHTIIWPSFLLGQDEDYNLPTYEFISQYLLAGDVQFSKSRGTGLTSEKALNLLPPDYWRFYIAAKLPQQHDTEFSWQDFESKINGTLNDTVGNYVNRVLSLAEQWFDNQVPDVTGVLQQDADAFLDTVQQHTRAYEKAIQEEKQLRTGLETAVNIARDGDALLAKTEPWNNEAVQHDVIYACLQSLQAVAICLYPYIPAAAETIWNQYLNRGEALVDGSNRLHQLEENQLELEPGHSLGDHEETLFEKIDADTLKNQVTSEENTDEDGEDEVGDTVSFNEFQNLDLRIGEIVDVAEHPNADKLYILQVETGEGTKQSCAGLKEYFEPDELNGERVVVVNNLETAELRGEKSECMVLAAEDDNGNLTLIGPKQDIAVGATVL